MLQLPNSLNFTLMLRGLDKTPRSLEVGGEEERMEREVGEGMGKEKGKGRTGREEERKGGGEGKGRGRD